MVSAVRSPFVIRSRRAYASFVAAMLASAIACGAPAHSRGDEPTAPGAREAARGEAPGGFRERVAIHSGRKLFIACRGKGSPTVVLEAGTGDLGRVWSLEPSGPGRPVFPAVSRFTRVCVYDRPGTYLLTPDRFSRSDPAAMPRTALDLARDLRGLLRAAGVPAPYVLAGHSFGGMVARLYATAFPRQIAGLVSIDAQNEDFTAAYKEFLTPEQYLSAVLDPPPPVLGYPDYERLALEASAAQVSQAQADTPLRRMPFVVLSHSRDLPNPFGFPDEWPIDSLNHAFQQSQRMLAELLPNARHVVASRSGHYIQLDQPRLVTREIRWAVRRAR